MTYSFHVVSKILINNVVVKLIGKINYELRKYREESGVTPEQKKQTSDAEKEYILEPNDEISQLISDYNEVSIQFGFMTLFIAACPFIPAIAFISNMIEIKSDGRKLLNSSR